MTSEPLTSLTTADRWREVCAQLRATDDISFKLLGFVPLFTVAAIGAVLFKADHRLSLGLILASFVGSITTLGFWIWERRNIQTCKWLRERAADIERAAHGPTHVGQFARLAPAPRGLGKTEGETIVYATTIAAWLCVPLLADADSILHSHAALVGLYGVGSLVVALLAWREMRSPIVTTPRGAN
jgi:hypothetical protein